MQSVNKILKVWPTAAALGRDIGVPAVTVRQWRNRSGAIPVRYWNAIREAAKEKGVDLGLDAFVPAEAE